MQKKFIALAVAGLVSGAAFAQSNVTVYGVADGTFDIVKASKATDADTNIGNFNRVSANSSHIGFKGSEALGNGLSAIFQFEAGVSFESAGALSTSRDSYVGATGGFGTVVLGKLTGPTRALGVALDVNAGATGIGANTALLGKLGNGLLAGQAANSTYTPGADCGRSATCASVFDTRWNNTVAYVSPNIAGFTGTFAYVANENKSNKGDFAAGDQVNTKGYDAGVTYKNGPLMAAVTYNRLNLGNADDTVAADLRAGASYAFGAATVRAVYDRVTLKADGADKIKQNVWGLGATFNITPAGKIVGQYYKAGDVKEGSLTADQTGAKLAMIGYEHSLSKRTMVKAAYSRLSNNDNAAYDFGVNSVGGVGAAGATYSGLSVGLRHAF